MERGSINPDTPVEWLHVRIEPLGSNVYSLRTYMLNGKFGPTALKAMNLTGSKTEAISKAQAKVLGERMERWLKLQNA